MVTGIETAGLALAVFPIVVGGLKFYADGARTIKDMWRYEGTLKSISRELGMEKCKFENTCTLLLEDVLSDSHLTHLMENPGGPLWGADDLQETLKSRLRPATVPRYLEAIEALALALKNLQDEFGLGEADKSDREPGDKRALKRKLKGIRVVLSKAEYKDQLAYIAKINGDLAMLTGQSKSANSPLTITAPAKHYQRIRNHAINLYAVLKEKLQAEPACACTAPHNANLRLEVRNATTTQKDRGQNTNLRFHIILSFETDPAAEMSLPWNWKEMGLEPLDSQKEPLGSKQVKVENPSDSDDKESHIYILSHPTATAEKTNNTVSYPVIDNASRLRLPFGEQSELRNIPRSPSPSIKSSFNFSFRRAKSPRNVSFSLPQTSCTDPVPTVKTPDLIPKITTKRIENLCLTIQSAKSEPACLGILTGESNRQYRVWPPRTPSFASEPMRVLSLESLLTQPKALKKKDRLILGVQLASTVMQLHTTEWLSENWGKRDILFHKESTYGESGGAVNSGLAIRRPLIRRIFAPTGIHSLPPLTIQEPTKPVLVPHDQSLFSLGVILLELWYGQRLEDLWIKTDGNGIGCMTDMTNYVTARRLINEISEDAGEKYGDAVRRCIIGLDRTYASLEADDFKNEVHKKVVSPLVENLESFCDMKLLELLV